MDDRRIVRDGDGYALRFTLGERELLRVLPGELRDLLETDDASLVRLFPSAYADDPDADEEFSRLVRDDLVDGILAALAVVEQTAGAVRLDGEQLEAWLRALESLRLVLGTRLDVSDGLLEHDIDPMDPRLPELELYGYLSWLQEQAVDALSAGL